jgi:hypothetical protein
MSEPIDPSSMYCQISVDQHVLSTLLVRDEYTDVYENELLCYY